MSNFDRTDPPHFPIAIIGGGLGGLTTAAVLSACGIASTVFELESGRRARTQGGMLDIHDDSGQVALHAAGVFDSFIEQVEVGGEAMRILDMHGTVFVSEPDDGTRGRPEIERGTLRDILLDSLPEDAV